jgi:hypothetical protein
MLPIVGELIYIYSILNKNRSIAPCINLLLCTILIKFHHHESAYQRVE